MKNLKYALPNDKQQNLSLRLVLALFCLIILGCRSETSRESFSKKEVIPVKVMKVELKKLDKTLDYVGDIRAEDEVLVYPKVSGKIIEKLKQDGEAVKKAEVLFYVDRDEVGLKFEKAPIESPLNGVLGRTYVDIGTSVAPQGAVALVVNMDKAKIYLDIPEAYLPKISVGQSAEIEVQAYADEKFTGAVSRISPVLDLETRTAPAEIIIANADHRLKSGMFAKTQLVIEEHKDIPVIMKEAVLGKTPNEYVYIVSGGVAHLQNIKLGIRQGASYEVLQGLKKGDLVVIVGQQRLYESANVLIEIEEARD